MISLKLVRCKRQLCKKAIKQVLSDHFVTYPNQVLDGGIFIKNGQFILVWQYVVNILLFDTNLKCSYKFEFICICDLFVHICLRGEKISQIGTLGLFGIWAKANPKSMNLGFIIIIT